VRNFARAPLLWRRESVLLGTSFALLIALATVLLPAGARDMHLVNGPALAMLPLALPALPEPSTVRRPEPRPSLIDGVYATIEEAPLWQRRQVQAGESLADIFRSQGYSPTLLERVLAATRNTRALSALKRGESLAFLGDGEGRMRAMQFDGDESTRVVLRVADDGGIYLKRIPAAIEKRVRLASGVITDSLFQAADQAGVPNGVMLKLADVFGYDIDFAQDLREGDRFAIVFEEVYRDGERLRDGDILAASFTNQGDEHRAIRFSRADGTVEFFGADGRSLKKAFLRTPVEFTRISSNFSVGRRHPILGTMRAHRGVDYAAPNGTPVRAAGDGRVSGRGWRAGYGNAVELAHGNKVSTLYGHLSRFAAGITNGQLVRQGQVIGYVGKTGLATGPHLHYEFRVNGNHRDPLKATMPPAAPLMGGELAQFRARSTGLVEQLALLNAEPVRLAQR